MYKAANNLFGYLNICCRYSFDLLKSQLLKATKRRDPDGMPLNGRIPRSDSFNHLQENFMANIINQKQS